MATQTIEFRAAPSQTVTLRLFVVGSDTEVANAAATEATNRKGTYAAAFTSVAAGEYQYVATIGTSPIIPLASGYVTLALATATYQVYDAAKAVVVNDKTGYSLATAPPTAEANALAVAQYDQRQQESTAGTIGWYFKKLRQANLAIEATVTADVTATTKTFSVNLTTYPTGAFRHAVMTVVEDSVILEQNSPIETFTNNTTFSTIMLEEELTAAPQPGDVIVIAANSHVHSIASITSGVWSALTSGLNVVGSTGKALARLIGLVEDSSGDRFTAKALEEAPAGGGGAGDASQATLLLVKAKTDLITSQTANQQQTPVNQMVIIRGDSYSGATRKTHAVTTDYTGYTATFTIRHRVTDAVLLSVAGAVDSSTQLSVTMTTANTAFALLVDATEFGPHPYDFRLVSGSIEKTESGIAIIRRDVTRA